MSSVIGPRQIAAGWVTFGLYFVIDLWSRLALKGEDLLPEVIQHGVRRRVPVMGSPMRLAASGYINSRRLLLENRRLHNPVLCVRHIFREQLPHRNEPVERFIPAREAISADHGGSVLRVMRHCRSPSRALLLERPGQDYRG